MGTHICNWKKYFREANQLPLVTQFEIECCIPVMELFNGSPYGSINWTLVLSFNKKWSIGICLIFSHVLLAIC